jgi:hypothetical protein
MKFFLSSRVDFIPLIRNSFLKMFRPSFPSSYLVPQLPYVSTLEECPITVELKALDRHRAYLRAQLADKALMEAATMEKVWYGVKTVPTEESKSRWAKRQARRAFEQKQGLIVPPGEWDDDLDNYPTGERVEVALPADLVAKGYRAHAARSCRSLTWNGYVVLPNDSPIVVLGKSNYDFFYHHERPLGMPSVTQEVTWFENNEVGWDHGHSYDVSPTNGNECGGRSDYRAPAFDSLHSHGEGYITFEGISKECVEMANALEECAQWLNARRPIPCPCDDSCGCGRDHWVLKAPAPSTPTKRTRPVEPVAPVKAEKRTWAAVVKAS